MPQAIVVFKSPVQVFQTHLLHATLQAVFRDIVDRFWVESIGERTLVVTEIFRTRAQTIAYYQAAGLPVPDSSPHETVKIQGNPYTGCRAFDISDRSADRGIGGGLEYAMWPHLEVEKLTDLVKRVNHEWRYEPSERHQVALLHNVRGRHLHFQVRPDQETGRRHPGLALPPEVIAT